MEGGAQRTSDAETKVATVVCGGEPATVPKPPKPQRSPGVGATLETERSMGPAGAETSMLEGEAETTVGGCSGSKNVRGVDADHVSPPSMEMERVRSRGLDGSGTRHETAEPLRKTPSSVSSPPSSPQSSLPPTGAKLEPSTMTVARLDEASMAAYGGASALTEGCAPSS